MEEKILIKNWRSNIQIKNTICFTDRTRMILNATKRCFDESGYLACFQSLAWASSVLEAYTNIDIDAALKNPDALYMETTKNNSALMEYVTTLIKDDIATAKKEFEAAVEYKKHKQLEDSQIDMYNAITTCVSGITKLITGFTEKISAVDLSKLDENQVKSFLDGLVQQPTKE